MGDQLPPLDFSELISDTLMQARSAFPHGLQQQATMLQPVGGMDRIAIAFEAEVLQSIVYEARVTEIRKQVDGARVVYVDRFGATQTLDADFCLCTIPATVPAQHSQRLLQCSSN